MILIPAHNASTWTGPTGNNTWLLTGRVPALIDAGVGAPEHVDAVAQALGSAALALIVVTHAHSDHINGVPALLARWPSARVRSARHEPLRDGERIEAGDTALLAIATPGHAPDHFCLFDETSRDLFCGDLARRGGTIVIPASKGGDLAVYLDSLRRIRDLAPARLLPGHGPIVDRPDAVIEQYLRHRAERDAQILEAVGRGFASPAAIVPEVYGTVPEPIVKAANDSVLAHLLKLEREGKVTRAASPEEGREADPHAAPLWALRRE